jgi:Spy/CpxP family protein refolding chaperone
MSYAMSATTPTQTHNPDCTLADGACGCGNTAHWHQRWVSLRKKTKDSLVKWRWIMRQAENEARSGDARTAREQVMWLKGYQRALNDVKQAND